MITLFDDKQDCCGCGACANVCTRKAITMVEDDCGFVYPHIDNAKCVECGACKKVCAFQGREEKSVVRNVYVAASNSKQDIIHSASGGVFYEAAKVILERNGVVYGAAMWREQDNFIVRHKRITRIENIKELQGSKYVQCDVGGSYRRIKDDLKCGKYVLFSGTPCQCSALRSFLRKDYDTLFIIDIICHGVPSLKFFNDYINTVYSNISNICSFKFRDKTIGWEMTARLDSEDNYKLIPGRLSSYFTLFLDGHTYRENCYSCKYASDHRPGDITIGDYWGFQREHPELLSKYDVQKGISCIIVNTAQGEILMDKLRDKLSYNKSTYIKVANRNEQLRHPSKMGKLRMPVMELYRTKGYLAVELFYRKTYRKQRLIHTVFNMLPYSIKGWIRKIK